MLLPELTRDDVFRIETPRLWLRWPVAADARALYRFASRADVALKTATWPHPLTEAEVDARILKARAANAEGRGIVLAIERKNERGRLAGQLGLHVDAGGEPGLSLGFMMDPDLGKRGIMTEAVGAAVDAVLGMSRFERIRGSCHVDNDASRRVFEKAGFEHVGDSWRLIPASSVMQACHDFELTRERWRNHEDARLSRARAREEERAKEARAREACVA